MDVWCDQSQLDSLGTKLKTYVADITMRMRFRVLEDDEFLCRSVFFLYLVGDGNTIVLGVAGQDVLVVCPLGWNTNRLKLALFLRVGGQCLQINGAYGDSRWRRARRGSAATCL